MSTHRHAADIWTCPQQSRERVAGIRIVILRGESRNGVVGPRSIGPLIAMRPDTELKINSAGHRLARDELQHLQVPIALCIGQVDSAHVISRNLQQERIGEQKVRIGYMLQKIETDPQIEAEPVNALSRQHRKVCRPHLAIVEPGLVLHIAYKQAADTADLIERLLNDGLLRVNDISRFLAITNPIS